MRMSVQSKARHIQHAPLMCTGARLCEFIMMPMQKAQLDLLVVHEVPLGLTCDVADSVAILQAGLQQFPF